MGSRYQGGFKNGSIHGFGIYFHSNGDKYNNLVIANRYEGEFQNGDRNGFGKMFYSNKSKYIKSILIIDMKDFGKMVWLMDLVPCIIKEDQGILTLHVLSSYTGEWVNNKKHGNGLFVYKNKEKLIRNSSILRY